MVVWLVYVPCLSWSGQVQQQRQHAAAAAKQWLATAPTYNQGAILSQGTIYLTVQTYCILLI